MVFTGRLSSKSLHWRYLQLYTRLKRWFTIMLNRLVKEYLSAKAVALQVLTRAFPLCEAELLRPPGIWDASSKWLVSTKDGRTLEVRVYCGPTTKRFVVTHSYFDRGYPDYQRYIWVEL